MHRLLAVSLLIESDVLFVRCVFAGGERCAVC